MCHLFGVCTMRALCVGPHKCFCSRIYEFNVSYMYVSRMCRSEEQIRIKDTYRIMRIRWDTRYRRPYE